MSELKEMEREEVERPNREKRPEVYREMANPANGVKKLDIWLLVCFLLKFRSKGPLQVWVWEGREEREAEGG